MRAPRSLRRASVILSLLLLAFAMSSGGATADGRYAADGSFDDWTGGMHLPDNSENNSEYGKSGNDIRSYYWGKNDGDPNLYFMIETYPAPDADVHGNANYTIHVDANDDGRFDAPEDRVVRITYQPGSHDSLVTVKVAEADEDVISTYSGNWGQFDARGAARVEALASFADLGISAHQGFRVYVTSESDADSRLGDRVPDAGDVRFSSVPVLGFPLLTLVGLGVVALTWWKAGRRVWKTR